MTPGGRGAWLPFFCVTKRKKGEKGKKERVRKQKILKGCHQGQNVTVLTILRCLEFKIFSCRPTIVADNAFQCSMVPPLCNPFLRPCDILIFIENTKQHDETLTRVLERFESKSITLNFWKSIFFKNNLKYYGFYLAKKV